MNLNVRVLGEKLLEVRLNLSPELVEIPFQAGDAIGILLLD